MLDATGMNVEEFLGLSAYEKAEQMMSLLVPTREEEKPATCSSSRKHYVARNRTARSSGISLIAPFGTRIVDEEALLPLLKEEWDIVRELTDGGIIVRRSDD